jgi:ATP synthase F1 gamma subunit
MINHKQILTKLNSYKNLYELTKAIQLVALSKLRALKKKELNRSLYPAYVLGNVKKIEESNSILIPITTDRSCCGSINNNIMDVVKYYSQIIKASYYLFLVGKKGQSLSKKFYNTELLYNLTEVTKYNLSIVTITILVEKLKDYNNDLKVDNYIFIYNYFKNIVSQQVCSLQIQSEIGFFKNLSERLNQFSYLTNILENKHNYFLGDLYDYILYTVLIKVLYENEMSEYGARASSMRNASKNAEELIAKLQLQYNKARQAHITNELIEIISCVNSIMTGDNLDKYSFYLQYVH